MLALLKTDGRYTGDVTIKVWKMKNQKLNGRPGEVNAFFNISMNRYYSNAQGGGNMIENFTVGIGQQKQIEEKQGLPF